MFHQILFHMLFLCKSKFIHYIEHFVKIDVDFCIRDIDFHLKKKWFKNVIFHAILNMKFRNVHKTTTHAFIEINIKNIWNKKNDRIKFAFSKYTIIVFNEFYHNHIFKTIRMFFSIVQIFSWKIEYKFVFVNEFHL